MRDGTIPVSIVHVNNEIGVVRDIATIGELYCPRAWHHLPR